MQKFRGRYRSAGQKGKTDKGERKQKICKIKETGKRGTQTVRMCKMNEDKPACRFLNHNIT